jgi:hypothetical protein
MELLRDASLIIYHVFVVIAAAAVVPFKETLLGEIEDDARPLFCC